MPKYYRKQQAYRDIVQLAECLVWDQMVERSSRSIPTKGSKVFKLADSQGSKGHLGVNTPCEDSPLEIHAELSSN